MASKNSLGSTPVEARLHWPWRVGLNLLPGLMYLFIMVPTTDLVTVLLLLPGVLIGVATYAILTRYMGPRLLADNETRCRACGYILRGITEPRCSECGERI